MSKLIDNRAPPLCGGGRRCSVVRRWLALAFSTTAGVTGVNHWASPQWCHCLSGSAVGLQGFELGSM